MTTFFNFVLALIFFYISFIAFILLSITDDLNNIKFIFRKADLQVFVVKVLSKNY
jgi:hypothetical protein